MSKYEIQGQEKGYRVLGAFCITKDGKDIATDMTAFDADFTAHILNKETAPLHATIEAQAQRISELEAANERMKKFALVTLMNMPVSSYPKPLYEQIVRRGERVGLSLGVISDVAEKYIDEISKPAQTPAAAPVADAPVQDEGFTMMNVVVRSINRYTTKHNEVMAVLATDKGEIVVFPRSWYEYKDVITEATILARLLLFRTKPDNSKGYTQYILESIEGVEPAEFPPALYCSNCGKRLGEACCKSNFVDGMFCSAACTSEYEKERHVPDMPNATPPAPRFKVGDKVRVKGCHYIGDDYDTVSVIKDEKYQLSFLDSDAIFDAWWNAHDLMLYSSESEGE